MDYFYTRVLLFKIQLYIEINEKYKCVMIFIKVYYKKIILIRFASILKHLFIYVVNNQFKE